MTQGHLGWPPPARAVAPEHHRVRAGTRLRRLYRPDQYETRETTFRFVGPLRRFDHHRAPNGASGLDPDRGVWYGGVSLSVCVVEIFGDSGIVELDPWRLATPTTSRDLLMLDLRGRASMRAGATAELAKTPDADQSQAWSRYFYENPDIYGFIDGLVYGSAHNDEQCFVLYERAVSALNCSDCSRPLRDGTLADALLRIGDYYGFEFDTAGWP
jgi:hypothetical protein